MSSSYWQFLTQSWDVKKRVQECFGGGIQGKYSDYHLEYSVWATATIWKNRFLKEHAFCQELSCYSMTQSLPCIYLSLPLLKIKAAV